VFSRKNSVFLSLSIYLSIPTSSKKRKVAEKMRDFQENWALEYYFVEFKQKPLYLICKGTVVKVTKVKLSRYTPWRHLGRAGLAPAHS
jgi:Uma2 family endonuclease